MRRRQVHSFCLIAVRLACWVCLAGVVAWAGPARAQTPPHVAASTAAQRLSASAERDRLRAELARVQTDIDRLKTGARGLRADYLLRGRLADAEALARRLTELDAQLGPRPDAAAARAPVTLPQSARDEAVPSPTDGPAELEAKADILADQSRRAQSQAMVLQARIDQVRGRRELRRRAHQLENDPFAPLESSHRRLAAGTSPAALSSSRDPAGPPRTVVNPPASAAGASGIATPPGPSASPVSPGATSGNATSGTGTQGTGTGTQGTGASTTSTPAAQVRDVLDPSTTAQVRRTDPGLAPVNDLASMEQALAALNARAQQLDAQAKRLRAQARAR